VNDDEPHGDRVTGDGDRQVPDADSWVAEWVDLFERPDPSADRERPDPVSDMMLSRPVRPAEVGDPIVATSGLGTDDEVTERPSNRRSPFGRRLAGLEWPAAEADDVAAIEAWQRAQERSRRKAQVRANQRAARQIRRALPDRAGPPQPVANVAVDLGDQQSGSVRRLGMVAGGLLTIIVGLVGYLLLGFGGADVPVGPGLTVPERRSDLELPVGAEVEPATTEQLTLSTVQLVGLDEGGVAQCAGSGVIVSPDGAILTNAHVVRSEGSCRFVTIAVAVTASSTSPPKLLYRAEAVDLDWAADLAVLRITGPLREDEGTVWPRTFVRAPLGDSDTVQLGDSIRVFGYPMIGGETITLTTGTVSGFTSQVGLGERALIKTDASIAAGSSGGMAVDAEGRVIGIPTKAQASERGPAVDCRPVSDTNEDGVIGDGDACVTVGGFLNGIRPINLAFPLLAAAGVSDSVDGSGDAPDGPDPDTEPLDVVVSNPRFSTGLDEEGLPINKVSTATAGIPRLCFTFDWQGIPLGTNWSSAWYLDSEIIADSADVGNSWTRKLDGASFPLCHEPPGGLSAGIYEVVFYLGDQTVFVESIEITPTPVEQHIISWTNDTGTDLCGLAINPAATSGQLGLNELPAGTVVPPGGHWQTTMPEGRVVVEAYDCDGEPVANRFDPPLEIETSGAISISSVAAPEN
jgi:S1-C subfamily serine protease